MYYMCLLQNGGFIYFKSRSILSTQLPTGLEAPTGARAGGRIKRLIRIKPPGGIKGIWGERYGTEALIKDRKYIGI